MSPDGSAAAQGRPVKRQRRMCEANNRDACGICVVSVKPEYQTCVIYV